MIRPLLNSSNRLFLFSSTQILPSKGSIDCTCSKLKAQAYLTRHDAQTLCRAFTRDWIAVLGNPFCPFTRIMEAKQTYAPMDFGIPYGAKSSRKRLMWAKCEEMDVSSIIQVGKMTLRESLSRDPVGHGQGNKVSNLHLKQTPSVFYQSFGARWALSGK